VHSTCLEACEPGKPPGISPLLLSQSAQVGSMPSLIELGETIGEGAQGRVIHGMGVIQGGFGSLYKNTDDAGAVSASTSYNKVISFRPPTHFSHMSHPTFPRSQILILLLCTIRASR